jgi:hypothetical protein
VLAWDAHDLQPIATDGTLMIHSFEERAMKKKDERPKDAAAVALSAKRMKKMTAKRRQEVARQGAEARWGKKKPAGEK